MAEELPEVNLKKSVREIWQEKLLLDYTVQVEDEEFRVHKVIMASVSDYFKAMLTGGMVESQTDRVKLEGLNPLAIANIIEYIYTNEISGTKAPMEDILACAVYLQIPSAIEAATQQINQKLDEKNCFDTLLTFQTFALEHAVIKTEQYIRDHLDEALEVNNVQTMCWESVVNLVKVWDRSDWDLFLMVKEWVEVDFENRKQHLDKVLSDRLHFYLLSPAQIEAIRKMRIYTDSEENEDSWHGWIDDAIEYNSLSAHEKVHQKPPFSREPSAVCFFKTEDSTDCKVYKLEKNNQWTAMTDFPLIQELPNSAAAVIEIDDFLFVCGQYSGTGTQKWHIFDPRTYQWSPMANFNTPRNDFAIVHDWEYIYAIGGRIGLDNGSETVTDSIERYDFETNTWTIIPATLPTPLQKACACYWYGHIFVTAGWPTTDVSGLCSPKLYQCDTSEDALTWVEKAPMKVMCSCKMMHAMKFDGGEFIVTMSDYFHFQYYSVYHDNWGDFMGEDVVTNKKLKWRGGGTVVVAEEENALYLLNFYHYIDVDSEDEEYYDLYVPEEQKNLCVRWTLSPNTDTITEHILPGFPGWKDNFFPADKNFICTVLGLPVRSLKGNIPVCESPKRVLRKRPVKTPSYLKQ